MSKGLNPASANSYLSILLLHGFVFVVIFIVGTVICLACQKFQILVLVKIDLAYVFVVFLVVVVVFTAFTVHRLSF